MTNQQNREDFDNCKHENTCYCAGRLECHDCGHPNPEKENSCCEDAAQEAREKVLKEVIEIVEKSPINGELCMCCSKIKKELQQLTTK